MNWLKKVRNFSLIAVALVFLCACGVKGDPLPPEKPADLGRGRPTYKRATEGLQIQKRDPVKDEDEDDEDERK